MKQFLVKAFVLSCLIVTLIVVVPVKLIADLSLWFIDEVIAEKFFVWLQNVLSKGSKK